MDYEQIMRDLLRGLDVASTEVPVVAAVFDEHGLPISIAYNSREETHDPTGHAEVNAIRAASQTHLSKQLEVFTLFTTLEPCVMCAGAIVAARFKRVVFGAWDERVGAAGSVYDLLRDPRLGRPIEVVAGVLADECSQPLKKFFENKR